MLVTALPNPVTAKPTSAIAKPPAPADGAFGATLTAAIANPSPVRNALRSEKRIVPKSDPGPDSKAISKSDAQQEVQSGILSGANTEAKSTSKISSKSGVSFTSQPAPKSSSKSGTDSDSDSDPHAASNKTPLVAEPSVTVAVPPAANNIADAIDNLPLPTQLLAMPMPEPAAAASGALSNAPAFQPAAPAPIGPDNAHSEVNTTAIGLETRKLNLSPGGMGADAKARLATAPHMGPLPGTNQTASELAVAAPSAPMPGGADSPAEIAAARGQFLSQLSDSAPQTVEASSAQPLTSSNFAVTGSANDTDAKTMPQAVIAPQGPAPQPPLPDATQQNSEAPLPPVASVAVAAASSPAALQPYASEAPALRIDPTVSVFSLTSSAPAPKSPLPGTQPSPASDPTSATQPPSHKSDRPADSESIHPPIRVSLDPAPSASASSDTGAPPPPQTPTLSETASVNGALPAAPNTNDAPPDQSNVDALPPAATDQKTVAEPVASGLKKSVTLPPDAAFSHDASRPSVPDRDPGVAVVTPSSSTAPQSGSQVKADQTSELPKTQQMLDSAPTAPAAPPSGRFIPTAANDVQMHVGIRTTAFGAVEIHTTVVQNQVGIAIHGERGLAHWFSSEVPNLESGLNDHRLNLTAVDFGSDRSGVQTATSFQHGQPRQNSSQTTGFPAAFGDQDAASESNTTDFLPSDLTVRPAGTRVSIRV